MSCFIGILFYLAIKTFPVHHATIIEGMQSLNFEVIKTRKKADEQLSQYITDFSTRQFLLKNLYWVEKEKLAWRFNLPVIHQNIETISNGIKNSSIFSQPTLFIRGSKSNYITPNDYAPIQHTFSNAKIVSIDTGHWVHAEKPEEFLQILTRFLL